LLLYLLFHLTAPSHSGIGIHSPSIQPHQPNIPHITTNTPSPQLYESNASPHLYWFVAKFFKRKGDSQPNYYRPSNSPGLFWREFGLFEHFFEKKTGIPWEKRLALCSGVAAPASGMKKEAESADGDSRKEIWYKLEDDGRRFVYEPPVSLLVEMCCWGVDAD
jgi:hypothetical protein